MVQKYIAALLVLTVLGFVTPCMAGDFTNSTPLTQTHLINLNSINHRAALGNLAGGLAFAPPQTPQAQKAAPAKTGELTTGGKIMKWVGIGLMAEGAGVVAYGATIKDPCSAYGPGYICTSNYTTVRATSFAAGGASIGIGAVLLIIGLHKKN
jgi:hypothetical protein